MKACMKRCRMRTHANGVKCGVMEQVKGNILILFRHMERKKNEEFVKNIYMRETECPKRRE